MGVGFKLSDHTRLSTTEDKDGILSHFHVSLVYETEMNPNLKNQSLAKVEKV